jgi:uncharacterized membrane protein YbhN (UPF0104 family)
MNISLGAAFAAASFLSMGVFDWLGLRYLGTRTAAMVPVRFAVGTGMVANAFSQSLGVAILTGSMIRIRAYERFGIGKADILRLSSFVTLTAVLGQVVTGMLSFLATPGTVRVSRFDLSPRPIGMALAVVILVYLAWIFLHSGRRYGSGHWSFTVPRRSIAALQVGLSTFDWICAATVLFFLLPSSTGIQYFAFLPVFFIAQTLATLSHVPGGAGVFEVLLVGLLAHSPSARAAVLASVLVYRLLYYVTPLVLGLVTASIYTLRVPRSSVQVSYTPLPGEVY